jgi:beta-phosphoglucomutase
LSGIGSDRDESAVGIAPVISTAFAVGWPCSRRSGEVVGRNDELLECDTLPTTIDDAPCLAIFDHDGVLVDSLEWHQAAWLELGRREGLPLTAEFIRETFGMTNPSIFRRLLGESIDTAEIARLGDLKEHCYREGARGRIALMPGVREVLDGLTAEGVRLAIGSSGPRMNLELTVESCGLVGRFASIAGLEDIRRGKPDPEVFLLAAERAGVPPSRSVVFEDAVFGIEAAKAAGMYAVGVGTTHSAELLRDAGADEAVSDLIAYPVGRLAARLRGGAAGVDRVG